MCARGFDGNEAHLLDVLVQHVGQYRVYAAQVIQVLARDVQLLLVMLFQCVLFQNIKIWLGIPKMRNVHTA